MLGERDNHYTTETGDTDPKQSRKLQPDRKKSCVSKLSLFQVCLWKKTPPFQSNAVCDRFRPGEELEKPVLVKFLSILVPMMLKFFYLVGVEREENLDVEICFFL